MGYSPVLSPALSSRALNVLSLRLPVKRSIPYPLFPTTVLKPSSRGTRRETGASPGPVRTGTSRSSIRCALAGQSESRRSYRRSFAVLSRRLAPVGVAPLQVDLFRVRLLHLLLGLLLAVHAFHRTP